MNSAGVFFTQDEVVIHNTEDDIWVVVNRRVFDLTNLINKRLDTMNDNLRLLIQFAGKDLSWAFDEHDEPLKRVNHNIESVPVFPPVDEKADSSSDFWWRDERNVIGKITCLQRRVRIINSLTRKTISMDVCDEDTIEVIKEKYSKKYNRDSDKYIWRKTSSMDQRTGKLFMDKTLSQNDILYEKNEQLGLPTALWIFYVLNSE